MDVNIIKDSSILEYDSALNTGGLDGSVWATITGSPSISGSLTRLNNAVIASFQAVRGGTVEFGITVPTAPATGDSKFWGLRSPSLGDKNKIVFDITDANFTAKAYDKDGTLLESVPITWDSDWTATAIRCRIEISNRDIIFVIDDTIVARIQDVDVYPVPLPIQISNSDTDNLDFSIVKAY